LRPHGRLAVISFHSLEDRIVKQFIAQHAREVYDRRTPFAPPQVMDFKAVQRIKPSERNSQQSARAKRHLACCRATAYSAA
jgi:16S rRNA (cytosine1402-N4)-methyltransferase